VTQDQHTNFLATIIGLLDASGEKWFLCFGSLLKTCRMQGVGIVDDLDIGIIGNPMNVLRQIDNCGLFVVKHFVKSDCGDDVYNVALRYNNRVRRGNEPDFVDIDLFFWVKKGQFYYHTYDVLMEQAKDGVLSEYTFKGIPADCFDAPKKDIEYYRANRHYQGAMLENGVWRGPIPGLEYTGLQMNRPYRYGACLDWWYPDFATVRTGVSESQEIIKVKSCREFYHQS